VDIPGAIRLLKSEARGEYLAGLVLCFETMWDLAMEILGHGEPVPYERCVKASTGRAPEPSDPVAKRERVAELLARAGYDTVDQWRRSHRVPLASIRILGAR